ncbi:MAG: hypothetical protein U0236_21270 [Nitrospira sp.]
MVSTPGSIVQNPSFGASPPTAPGPVIDAKTGADYPTLAAGLAGSVSTVLGPFPVGAASRGQVVPAGLPVQPDDFYKGQYLAVSGVTPSFPNVNKTVLIVAYDSASGTLYLEDDTLLVAGTDDVHVIDLAELNVYWDLAEGLLPISGPVRINFMGNAYRGGFDLSDSALFVEFVDTPEISDGVVINEGSCFRARNCVIAPRGTQLVPFGLAISSLSDERGRIELYNCDVGEIHVKKNRTHFTAIASKFSCRGSGRVGLPVRLAYAENGESLKLFQFSCDIDSMFAGTFIEADDTGNIDLTNIPQIAINANIRQNPSSQDLNTNPYPDVNVAFARGVGTGNIPAGDVSPGSYININLTSQGRIPFSSVDPNAPVGFAWINVHDFSGTIDLTAVSTSVTAQLWAGTNVGMCHVMVTGGGAPMTGTVTADTGIDVNYSCQASLWSLINYSGDVNGGTIDINADVSVWGSGIAVGHAYWVNQTNPVVTVNGAVNIQGSFSWFFAFDFTGAAGWAGGTVTHNGVLALAGALVDFVYLIGANIAGATFTVNGDTYINRDNLNLSSGLTVAQGGGLVGTSLVVNGNVFVQNVAVEGIIIAITGDMDVNVTGAVIIQNYIAGNIYVILNVGAGLSSVSGSIAFIEGRLSGDFTAALLLGAFNPASTGPARLRFDHTVAVGATMLIGPNVPMPAWINSDVQIRNSDIENAVTLDGAVIAAFDAYNSFFAANFIAANSSIHVVSANIPNCILWNCQHYGGITGGGFFPLVTELRDFIPVPTILPLAFYELHTIDPVGNAVPCAPGSIVEGVTPFGYAPGDNAILARDFSMPVHSDPAVLTGDNLVLNPGAPTTAITGPIVPGQEIGRAMEPSAVAAFGVNYPYVHGRVR